MQELIFMIGLSGSGKSTYAEQIISRENSSGWNKLTKKWKLVSSDEIRKVKFGDINDQTHNEEVFDYAAGLIKEYLNEKHSVVFDATNITCKSRISMLEKILRSDSDLAIKIINEDIKISYKFMATPLERCLTRNELRERTIPEEVIIRQYKSFETPCRYELAYVKNFEFYDGGIPLSYEADSPNYLQCLRIPHDNSHHTTDTIFDHCYDTSEIIKDIIGTRYNCDFEDNNLVRAAFFHDIGKPQCKKMNENGEATYYNHDHVGCYEAMLYGTENWYDENDIIEVCNLILYHMQIRNCNTDKARQKLIDKVGLRMYHKLLALSMADTMAH